MQALDPYLTFLVATHNEPERWFILIPLILYCWIALYPLFGAFYRDGGYGKALFASMALFVVPVGLVILVRILRNYESSSKAAIHAILVTVAASLALLILLRTIYHRERRLSSLWSASAVAGIAAAIFHVANIDRPTLQMYHGTPDGQTIMGVFPRFLSVSLVCMFLAIYLGILYEKIFERRLTDREAAPGRDGLRAWLSPGRLALCFILAGLASFGYDAPFLAVLGFGLLGLAAYPLAQTYGARNAPGAEDHEDPPAAPGGAERARILKLLEDGRINAQECQELLQALAESTALPSPVPHQAATLPQRLRWVGAGLILLGFFLPWFVVDLGREMQRTSVQLNQAIDEAVQVMPGAETLPQFPTQHLAGFASKAGTITVGAEDLRYGLGFIILLLGLGALVLPWALADMNSPPIQRIALLALAAGGILVLYLTISNFRYLHAGPLATLAGYILAIIAVARDAGLKLPAPTPAARAAQTEP